MPNKIMKALAGIIVPTSASWLPPGRDKKGFKRRNI